MAKSPALVNAVAEVLFEDPKTVKVALRRLQTAGLIVPGGKGRAGRDMTPADAVMLLLGVANGETLKNAPKTVMTYSRLERTERSPALSESDVRTPESRPAHISLKMEFFRKLFLHKLPQFANFGGVLETILRRAADDTLFPEPQPADFFNPERLAEWPDFRCERMLNVRLYGPARWPVAVIDVGYNKQFRHQLHFGDAEFVQIAGLGFVAGGRSPPRYFEMRQIPLGGIDAIAATLR
jgi:hypothetical protein